MNTLYFLLGLSVGLNFYFLNLSWRNKQIQLNLKDTIKEQKNLIQIQRNQLKLVSGIVFKVDEDEDDLVKEKDIQLKK